jgi:hypothetical protein
MTYKDNTPTFNINRNIVNYKDFIQQEEGIKEGIFSDRYKDDSDWESPKNKLTESQKSEIKTAFENTVLSARTNSPKEAYEYAEKMANYVINLIEK